MHHTCSRREETYRARQTYSERQRERTKDKERERSDWPCFR